MAAIDTSGWELHNVIRRSGALYTRPGLRSVATPTSGFEYVAGFTVDLPTSGEVLHYCFEQSTTTGTVVFRLFTEEFLQLASMDLGVMRRRPRISWAIANNQVMVNSPSFSVPLYGQVGGSLIPARRTASVVTATTALEIPVGHICSFGDRMAIAAGPLVYFNDPGVDPRTFVAENVLSLPGAVLDILQGPNGALVMFTSRDVYMLASDALGQGQLVQGFVSTITGMNTSQPGNACKGNGVLLALTADGIVQLSADGQELIPLATYDGRRALTPEVEEEDLRAVCVLYPTTTGALCSFPGRRGYLVDINLRDGYRSFISSTADLEAVGTLRGRDGEDLYLLRNRVVQPLGSSDFTGVLPTCAIAGRVELEAADSPTVRWVTLQTDALGATTRSSCAGGTRSLAAPTFASDAVVGTDVWGPALTFRGRELRAVRHPYSARSGDIHLEVGVDALDRRLGAVDVEFTGQDRKRRSGG